MSGIPNLFCKPWYKNEQRKVNQLLEGDPSQLTKKDLALIKQHLGKVRDYANAERHQAKEEREAFRRFIAATDLARWDTIETIEWLVESRAIRLVLALRVIPTLFRESFLEAKDQTFSRFCRLARASDSYCTFRLSSNNEDV